MCFDYILKDERCKSVEKENDICCTYIDTFINFIPTKYLKTDSVDSMLSFFYARYRFCALYIHNPFEQVRPANFSSHSLFSKVHIIVGPSKTFHSLVC